MSSVSGNNKVGENTGKISSVSGNNKVGEN
jgi:hypothetical protein